jgi:hypothetical protein
VNQTRDTDDRYPPQVEGNVQHTHNTLLDGIRIGARKPPTMTQVVMFNLFKWVSEVYPEKFSADHVYYQDKTGYYDESKVSFWKNMIAGRVLKGFQKDIAANRS